MKLLNVTYVKSIDTGIEALYVLGKLFSFSGSEGFDWEPLLKKHVVHISHTLYVDEDWFFETYEFPAYLSEVEIDHTKGRST
jgi:hypothetical protein